MKKQLLQLALWAIAIILFNILFWQEGLGLNVFLFTLFSFGITFKLYPELFKNQYSKWFAGATIVSAGLIVINHSIIASVVYFLSYLIFIGFSFAYHRFQVAFAGLQGLKNIIMGPIKAMEKVKRATAEHLPFKRFFYYLKLILIPLTIVIVFLFLYSFANEHLAAFVVQFTDRLLLFFKGLSFDRISFFVLSFLLVSALLMPNRDPEDVLGLKAPSGELTRVRRPSAPSDGKTSTIGLKSEYRIAQITFWGLNMLIFAVNALDVFYVWAGKISGSNVNLKSHLHEGTYMLIFSILLAMIVVLVFFRRNLNFFPKNKGLKLLTYAWIMQNAVLMISVAIRNYRYIQWHGLAYKRIGVLLFLLLVAFGLWTMYAKVKHRHTLKHLLRQNSLAVFVVLLLTATVNWDVFITKFNLKHDFEGQIDTSHLLHVMSDKNYRMLHDAQDGLLSKPSYPEIYIADINDGLYKKQISLEGKRKHRSWLSWNWQDWKNWKYLDAHELSAPPPSE